MALQFRIWPVLCLSAGIILAGCSSPGRAVKAVVTQSEQKAMTPAAAQARLAEGNRRFTSGKDFHRDYMSQVKTTAAGQYPFAVVLACIDSRSAPEIVFDQGLGDLFVPRLAGNYATTDVIGGMEFATKVSGAKLVVVMGHTECGAIKGAIDNVQLGNLTMVMDALKPAVEDVKNISTDRTSKNKKFVIEVTEANVRRTVEKIRADSPVMRELEQSGQLKIVGAMYDISSGQVVFLN